TRIAVVNIAGNNNEMSSIIGRQMRQILLRQPGISLSRHNSLEQAVGGGGVEVVIDGDFLFEREFFLIGKDVFQQVSLSARFRLIRIDHTITPPVAHLLLDLPVAVSRSITWEEQGDLPGEIKQSMCAELCQPFFESILPLPRREVRRLSRNDPVVARLLARSQWREAFDVIQERIRAGKLLSHDEFYCLALCCESMGEYPLLKKAADYYFVALDKNPGLAGAARGLARLEWGRFYQVRGDDEFVRFVEPGLCLPFGSGIGVLGSRSQCRWLRRDRDQGKWKVQALPEPDKFPLGLLARRYVEASFNRLSPWRHRHLQMASDISSVEQLFDRTGGKIFECGETDFLLFLDVREEGIRREYSPVTKHASKESASIKQQPVITWSDSVYLTATVISTRPFLRVLGRVSGSAAHAWTSGNDSEGSANPLVTRIRLVERAVSDLIAKLSPRPEVLRIRYPRCDPLALSLLHAGAYRIGSDRLRKQLHRDDLQHFMAAAIRAENLYALGLCYEGRGGRFYTKAAAAYSEALTLDQGDPAYNSALVRINTLEAGQ
ncbi:hypothetical protein ACFL54_09535, partial [Planctomycetota bacterium]